MHANSVVRARIDERIRNEADAVLKPMGLTVSHAFWLMMVRIAREKSLPFDPLVPNDNPIEAMKAGRDGELATAGLPEKTAREPGATASSRSSPISTRCFGLVWLLSTGRASLVRRPRRLGAGGVCAPSGAGRKSAPASAAAPPTTSTGPTLLRGAGAVHHSRSLCAAATLPMRTPTTGEPYAGEPHLRFGGRRGANLPAPYCL
jgi:DNA-damage-inducible protein J